MRARLRNGTFGQQIYIYIYSLLIGFKSTVELEHTVYRIQSRLNLEHRLEIQFFFSFFFFFFWCRFVQIFLAHLSCQKKWDSPFASWRFPASQFTQYIYICFYCFCISAISVDHFPASIVHEFKIYLFWEIIEHAIYVHNNCIQYTCLGTTLFTEWAQGWQFQ